MEKTKSQDQLLIDTFVGRTVTVARYANKEELKALGWFGETLAIFMLDDGTVFYASADHEHNRPGVIITSKPTTMHYQQEEHF